MKKKLIYILLTTTVLMGCKKDILNTKPLDQYSNETLWSSKADANAALTGCYSGWETGDNVIYDDCLSDNGIDQFPWENYETFASGLATASDSQPGVNKYSYLTIQRCNWFLDNVDKVPSASLDNTLKERMKSEARFLRAYRYAILTQMYGDVPFTLHNLTTDEANKTQRSPKAQVVDFVLQELASIAPSLPVSYSGSDIGRITRGAALALKARVELFNAKYTDCITTTQQLMTGPFNYSLYPDYEGIFRPQNSNNQEVILDVQYLQNDNSEWVLGAALPNSHGGWSSMAPTQALVDAYETTNGKTIQEDGSYNALQPYTNRDPRLDAAVIHPGLLYMGSYFDPLSAGSSDLVGNNNASPTGYNFKKYLANIDDYNNTAYGTDVWNTGGSIIVIRYAEVLLTYAEAKIEANQIDPSVYDAINKVRQRPTVNMPAVTAALYPDQASLRVLIRRERRAELAGEGLRWYDIQRWKIGADVLNGDVKGSLKGSVNPSNGVLTLTPNSNFVAGSRTFDNKNYLWPIPQKEFDINPSLKQNPGY
ncbi:RagB/SusD family nutrient uptake outer membrane protein [Pedobacter gandavensis]|uniref:RagB/SusD family nutrient uptake outer membrane protein n=1 Tax=Pedobacter gandavensis TaxID=2679963 RepID=A0ABR6EZF4_9SPHI|nr:RagB/SusD family nutrient uptake outer membrane protein [Pedobacter gandavensis]MBB2150663.1 RagB/SusD family nutrient uptake outer membrane protein [Pedobacter gandavensis]